MIAKIFKFAIAFGFVSILFFIGADRAFAANACSSTGSGGNFNVSGNWTSCGGTTPQAADTITITSGAPITLVAGTTVAGVTINSSATLHGSTFLLTDTGNFTDNGTYDGSAGLTVSGASSVIDGSGAVTNSSGTIISGGSGPSFAATASTSFSGNLLFTGSATITAGAVVNVAGTTSITGSITVTNNGTFWESGSGGITGSASGSTWTQGTNSTLYFAGSTTSLLSTGTLNATNTGNTIDYNASGAQTCKNVQYYNLIFDGGGTITCAPTTAILNNLNYNNGNATGWTLSQALAIVGNFKMTTGTIATGNILTNVTGTTEIAGGTFGMTSCCNIHTFNGLVTIDGGTISGASATTLITFQGGVTYTSGTMSMDVTFGANNQTASGTPTFGRVTVASGVTLTVSGSLTATGNFTDTGTVTNNGTVTTQLNLTGAGTWTQGANSTLNATGGQSNAFGVTTISASSTGNTVNYNASQTQTCATVQYYNLTFDGTSAKTCAPTSPTLGNVTMNGAATWTLTGSGTINGTVNVAGGTFDTAHSALTLTVNGTTTVSSGTLSININSAATTFVGAIIVSGGTMSGACPNIFFEGGITQSGSGTVGINTGTVTFPSGFTETATGTIAINTIIVSSTATLTNGGTFTTSAASTITGTLVNSGTFTATNTFTVTGTVTNNGTFNASSTLTGAGTWTQGTNSTLNATGQTTNAFNVTTIAASSTGNTVNYALGSGTGQTCAGVQYYNLSFSGSGTKTCVPSSTILGSVTVGGTAAWTLTTAITVSSTLTISGGTLTTGAAAFAVTSSTSITSGTLSLTNATGAKTLSGLVSLSGGTLSAAATSTFGLGIANNGGTVSVTVTSTFATAGANLSGSSLISLASVIVTSPGAVTNSGTSTLSGTLTGNGSWTQGSGGTLNLSTSTASIVSVSTFDAHTSSNTVNYSGGAQTCLATQYYNLTFSGGGTKTCTLSSSVLGNLNYNATGTWVLAAALTVAGNFTISTGTVDTGNGSNFALNLSGNFTNSGGVYTARNNTTTLQGTGQQTVSGAFTGTSAFYSLAVTNSSGAGASDCELTGFTPSVIFNASDTATNYTITTGDVKVQYASGATYTFTNTNWVAPSGHPIFFRNSVAGSGTWLLKVSGTQQALAYVNVNRSDASGGSTISAAAINNRDCINNTNWNFGAPYTSPTLYSQVAYQLYQNQNAGQVGATLAAANATATLSTPGQAFRLRILLAVDATNSIAAADSFMLQYANKGNGASCAATQFSYAAITSSTAIAYNTNSNVTNGAIVTATSTDPVDGGRVVTEETYQSGGNFTPTTTISAGGDGNWDFSLKDNGTGNTDYCFQIVFSSSTSLYAYSVYPEVISAAASAPTVSGLVFNGGSSHIILLPATTATISVVASSTDPSGPGNLVSATGTIYRTSLGNSCSANNLNCYQITTSGCVFSASTSTITCSAGLWYFAQSTNDPSSSYPSDSWTAAITIKNGSGFTATATSSVANVDVLNAISVTTSSINYGTLNASSTSGSTNQTTTVQNAGNSSSSLQLSGTAFINGSYTLATSSQHYATSSFTFGGAEQVLSDSATTISGFKLTAPTSTTAVAGNIYWGITVPIAVAPGSYTATTTFTSLFTQ